MTEHGFELDTQELEHHCPTCNTEPAELHAVLGHSPAPYGIGASLATAPRDERGEVLGVLA